MMAFVLGLGIPVAIIYILNLLSYRIEGRADVERLTNVSIIGDVPLNDSEDKHAIAVRENDNDIMAETFRSLRTNLLFMLGDPDRKVILVTSTMSGEGKTFIASNLAVSLALLGKKVIIVGLDIRKPGLNKVFRIHHKEKGITGFLSAPQSTDLRSMILPSEVSDQSSCTARWSHPAQSHGTVGTQIPGRCHRTVEKRLRLCRARHCPYRHGHRHAAHSTRCRHQRLRMPCRLYA